MATPYARRLLHKDGKALLVPGGTSRTFAIGVPRIGHLHRFSVAQAKPTTAVSAGGGGTAAAFGIRVATVPRVADAVTEPWAGLLDPTDVDEAATIGLPPYSADKVINRLYPEYTANDTDSFYDVFPAVTDATAGSVAEIHQDHLDHPYELENHWFFLTITPTGAADPTLWEVSIVVTQ